MFRDGVELSAEQLPAQVAAATGRRVPSEEEELVFEDGRRVHMILGAEPLLDANGRPRGSVTAGIDITALKHAEQQLRESEERFRTLASNAQDSITRFDREGRYVYVNPVASRLLGLPDEAILGKTVEELGRNVGTERWESHVREVFHSGAPQRFDRKSVDERWYDVNLIPEFRGADVVTVLSIARDITERKRAEEALRDANARLVEVDQRKNEFLAVLSHELRNPLTPIRYSLHILERAAPGSERRSAPRRSSTGRPASWCAWWTTCSTSHASRATRSSSSAGSWTSTTSFGAPSRTIASLFDEKGITVEATFAPEPLPINGDEARLAQVVGNLLQNAAKFTPAGGRVSVATGMVASRTRVGLRVIDTGAGIEPAMLRRLFQPFMQADVTLDRSKGGLGLGLALVKGLVEMHGGEVCAHSDGPGKGAEFVVELPLDVAAAARGRVSSGNAAHRAGAC